jgi:hypothetical protein
MSCSVVSKAFHCIFHWPFLTRWHTQPENLFVILAPGQKNQPPSQIKHSAKIWANPGKDSEIGVCHLAEKISGGE